MKPRLSAPIVRLPRSAAHSPAVKDRSTYSGAERPARGCGDTLSPRGPPAYARGASGTRVRRLFPGTPRACDRGPPAPKPVWHALRPALAARPWERSWLVHTARPALDAGVLRQYIPNAYNERGTPAEPPRGGCGVAGIRGTGRAQRRRC